MKRTDITPGMHVVCNPLNDAAIYTVESIDELGNCKLFYTDLAGRRCNGGIIHCGALRQPSRAQLTREKR